MLSYALFWTLRTASAMVAAEGVARPSAHVLTLLADSIVAHHRKPFARVVRDIFAHDPSIGSPPANELLGPAAAHWIRRLSEREPTPREHEWQARSRADVENVLIKLSRCCSACSKEPRAAEPIKACAGCGVCYCSVECQRANRKAHKPFCFRAPIAPSWLMQ